jgi:addiction module HigA family antidote
MVSGNTAFENNLQAQDVLGHDKSFPGSLLSLKILPLDVSRQTVNELLRERRSISPSMALRLSRLFGNTPEFWLNAQQACDLWKAQKDHASEINRISPLNAA